MLTLDSHFKAGFVVEVGHIHRLNNHGNSQFPGITADARHV